MARNNRNLNLPENFVNSHDYVFPRKMSGNSNNAYPTRVNREQHAETVLEKLNNTKQNLENFRNTLDEVEESPEGFYIEVKGESKTTDEEGNEEEFELRIESLDDGLRGFEVVTYKKNDDGSEQVVVYIPEGKIDSLENKIRKSFEEQKPKFLVDSISDLKLAILQSLWTSDDNLYPQSETEEFVWEVWTFGEDAIQSKFQHFCHLHNISIFGEPVGFVDRKMFIVKASAQTLSNILHYQKIICELRKPADTPHPIVDGMNIEEQFQLTEDFVNRLNNTETNSEVWVLDTGLNLNNPLLESVVDASNAKTINPSWGTHDDHHLFHGTNMTGLAQFGDVLQNLLNNEQININHSVGSIKILPPVGTNTVENYPYVMEQAIAESEIASPNKDKIYSMAVTDPSIKTEGNSTSWSATLDKLSFGDNEEQRLFIVSGGNARYDNYPFNYPAENELISIQDPAQSWNSLTVGAYTDLDNLQEDELIGGWSPLAEKGSLSPSSTTTLTWSKTSNFPLKPELVMEGGNLAVNNEGNEYSEVSSLGVITTSGAHNKVFDYTYGTSSATALTSNIAGRISAEYPDYWPETVRGLLIHSAKWSEKMIEEFSPFDRKIKVHSLIRKYGYGIPSYERAITCAQNEVTLISQRTLKPYRKNDNDHITYENFDLIDLPWPTEVLRNLGETEIKLNVTISYYIEPNPSRRGNIKKYQYSSFGLRFTTMSPTDSIDSFKRRVSGSFEDVESTQSDDNDNWFLGPDLRTRGSVHTDTWTGTAAELAGKSKLAVYPVGGWWKEYKNKERWQNDMRYSLIISIESTDETVEIYNHVMNLIDTEVEIEV